ncbi:Pep3/Vps18/deep orange family-domain-containing protein [Xylariaceae sp. FL0804]|nr:Pep3/Vps18/deep orange family-domain-containing protein [Xylariaceae sp. FL0804]
MNTQMALDGPSHFAAANGLHDLAEESLPIFDVEHVKLQFSIAADFVAAQVANNVLVLALSNGRILRIDLNRPEDIDDIDLPKRVSEVGVIRRMFLDPTASHLLICTSLGENYYLHTQSRQPRPLSRLRGVAIECVAWNPSQPTSSTREIILGAADGNIYETFIETSTEFYRREEKYLKALQRLPDGPVTGLWVDSLSGGVDVRRVVISTQSRIFHLVGRVGRSGHEGSGSIYTRLFDGEQPVMHEVSRSAAAASSMLSVSPDPPETDTYDDIAPERAFAWLSSQGVYHGKLLTAPASNDLGHKIFAEASLLPRTQITSSEISGRKRGSSEFIDAVLLTQWHIVSLVGGRVVAANRLTGSIVYDQAVLDQGQNALGLYVDQQKNTYWLFTNQEIFEIVVQDEARDVWKIMLQRKQFDMALQYAHTPTQKDAVATASGDYLAEKGQFIEAAGVYGKSSKPFEEVALAFIDNDQSDALRKYLLTKLNTFKKTFVMQRMMIATWLVEIYMAKLNSLEDAITMEADGVESGNKARSREELNTVRSGFHDFVNKHRTDLDRKTIYDVISSHAREDELLFFANAVNDYNYELSYWVQRERWTETLNVLKKQTDPEVFYRYSSVLMTHVGHDLVEILMRQPKLEPRRIIPALLDYNRNFKGTLLQNQAIRYLQFVINQLQSPDPAVHNTLVSMYASHESKGESGLLAYLESQGEEPHFDPDFALRLCIQHKRTLSCVHIYTNMGQYVQAVDLALSHNEVEYASIIADRPMSNPALRKKLWLAVARKVISQSDGIKTAIEFLRRCDLLKIEDLIPFFPDFVVIDDFKDEICAALEDYARSIDGLRREMDESSQTAAHIRADVAALGHRYAVVEPGERCHACGLPLLSRQFFVFPCQHAFHSDCLGRRVLEQAGVARGRRIRECQVAISKGLVAGPQKEQMVAELDALVASAWCVRRPLLNSFALIELIPWVVSCAATTPSSASTSRSWGPTMTRTNGRSSWRGYRISPHCSVCVCRASLRREIPTAAVARKAELTWPRWGKPAVKRPRGVRRGGGEGLEV